MDQEKMKAITLYQPHALFVATGWKEVETRDWYTSYRGPLAIHSSKRFTNVENRAMIRIFEATPAPPSLAGQFDFGCVLATCNLVACIPTMFAAESSLKLKPPFTPVHGWDVELEMGNYTPGRWAWILRDVVRLSPAIPARGYRKLWTWTPRVVPNAATAQAPPATSPTV